MLEPISDRRYLVPFKASRLPQQFTDVLVIGGGVAGLRSAIAAAEHGADVLLLTKDTLAESNTWYAQGGIAAVLQPLDSVESHVQDTLIGGAGLCDEKIVRLVITEGPQRVLELLEWGANFDKDKSKAYGLAFTREGGHSFDRILHAYGDATGRELAETLIRTVRQREAIRISENSFVLDLLTDDSAPMRIPGRQGVSFPSPGTPGEGNGGGLLEAETQSPKSELPPPQPSPGVPGEGAERFSRCVGAIALINGQLNIIWAKRTILASGGAGQLYRETTNPTIATADGHAMAYRAGANLRDMEMVQFHPTTLYVAGSSRALITEAVRGEGAYLVDRTGRRFMKDYDPAGEMAPRDIVSRAIVSQIQKTNFTHVFLDVRHLTGVRERFPQLAKLVDQFDIDVSKDLIPVHPAAHYMIGGVDCDDRGQTSLPGLYAVGEASCTGLHGANRLGSNSLLEGLAFGARAGTHAAEKALENKVSFPLQLEHRITPSTRTELDIVDVKSSLRSVMWRNVGIERDGARLSDTSEIIAFWARYVMDKTFDYGTQAQTTTAGWELQNMLTICALITASAADRTESRGAHYRLDYPKREDGGWKAHLIWHRAEEKPEIRPIHL